MRSEIRNIRYLAKFGAYGQSGAVGFYIYGRRRDGRTVPCKSEILGDGSIEIYSQYSNGGAYLEEDMTEFSKEEWAQVKGAAGNLGARICNSILDRRNYKRDKKEFGTMVWRMKSLSFEQWPVLQKAFADFQIILGAPENLAMFACSDPGENAADIYITGPGIEQIESISPGGWQDSDAPSGANISLLVGSGDPWSYFFIKSA